MPENGGTEFFHDLRSIDLSSIDLSDKLDYLLTADFDDDTVWPNSLPKEFDIEKIKNMANLNYMSKFIFYKMIIWLECMDQQMFLLQ